MKKQWVLAGVVASLLMAGSANAATAQQEKMKTCNAQASGKALKGDERKTFMSTCLKKDSDTKALTTQQTKMKTCNAQAGEKSLKGDARKSFMSTCLKG